MYGEAIGRVREYEGPQMPVATDEAPLHQALSVIRDRVWTLDDHMASLLNHVNGPSLNKNPNCGQSQTTAPPPPPSLMDLKRQLFDGMARLEEKFQILASALS